MKGKKLLGLLLAVMMVISMAACGTSQEETAVKTETETSAPTQEKTEAEKTEAASSLPEWLNATGTLPIVKEGTEKTLRIYCKVSEDAGKPEDLWVVKDLIEGAMNIDVEVTTFNSMNQSEILSLAFASGELPDVIIGGGFSTADLIKYGASEGQIIDLAPYINEENAPRLTAIFEENPTTREAFTDSEGHMWSLGAISSVDTYSNSGTAYLNYALLEECGLEVPRTLDEFVDAMRVFKEKYGEDYYPITGSNSYYPVTQFILNAFGYITTNTQGIEMAMRNGEPVLPYADREVYGEYLKLMNTLYTEKLIHPDFYTMDKDTVKAHMADNTVGFLGFAPFIYQTASADWEQYFSAYPLTSQWHEEAAWPSYAQSAAKVGQFVVTSVCEEPELAIAFCDWFYDITHLYMAISGPEVNMYPELVTEEATGWYWDPAVGCNRESVVKEVPEGYNNSTEYAVKKIQLFGSGTIGYSAKTQEQWDAYHEVYGLGVDLTQDPQVLRTAWHGLDETDGADIQWNLSNYVNMAPYFTHEQFPKAIYLSVEDSEYLSSMKLVMDEYATQETAKFVTGARSLDELDAYFDELDRLGATEYVEFYTNYYNSMK